MVTAQVPREPCVLLVDGPPEMALERRSVCLPKVKAIAGELIRTPRIYAGKISGVYYAG
jgi:hypothetical protein